MAEPAGIAYRLYLFADDTGGDVRVMAAGNLSGHVTFPEDDTGDVAADTGIAITIDLQFTDVMRHQGRRAGVFARQQRRGTGTVLGIFNTT